MQHQRPSSTGSVIGTRTPVPHSPLVTCPPPSVTRLLGLICPYSQKLSTKVLHAKICLSHLVVMLQCTRLDTARNT